MKEALSKLERKLTWWKRTKIKLAVVAVAACSLGLVTNIAWPYLSKNIKEDAARKELVEDPVPEIDAAAIRDECLDDVVIKGAYKKYEQLITGVSERTGVPKYVLAASIEDGLETAEGLSASEYGWHGFVKITEKEAGVKESTLWKDPEQCLLTVAGKYKKIFDNVKDEETALGVLFTNEDQVKSAKKQARICMAILINYTRWRDACKPEALKPYDELMEQIDNEKDRFGNKAEKLQKKIIQLWDSFEPGISRGGISDEPVYRVLTGRKYHRRGQWWPEQIFGRNGIKIALRLKKDGYR